MKQGKLPMRTGVGDLLESVHGRVALAELEISQPVKESQVRIVALYFESRSNRIDDLARVAVGLDEKLVNNCRPCAGERIVFHARQSIGGLGGVITLPGASLSNAAHRQKLRVAAGLHVLHALQELYEAAGFPEAAEEQLAQPGRLLLRVGLLEDGEGLGDLSGAVELLDEVANQGKIGGITMRSLEGKELGRRVGINRLGTGHL